MRCKIYVSKTYSTTRKDLLQKEFEGFMNKRAGNSQGWLNAEEHVKKKNKTTFERRFKYIKKHLKKIQIF